MADKERTHGRHMVDTHGADARGGDTKFGGRANTWRTNGRQGLEPGPKRPQGSQGGHVAETRRSRRTQGGQTADTRRTKNGDTAKAESRRTQGGHMADKHRGRGQSISRPAFFLLRENPTVNCLGNQNLKRQCSRP